MPSSFLEATKQLGGSSEPSQQVTASESIGARTIVLTFPGFPSCCTEILINFEDDHGSDSKGTQSEVTEMWPPQHNLPATSREESEISQIHKPCEDAVTHEFDQSTVYIGLDSGITVGRKKARKKTDSLVRTLPILAHCSKRWLHFRGKKSHERGRVCAFESGDVGKIIDSSLSAEDRNDSPTQKFDTKQTFVSPRTPFTFVNPKATFSTTASHDRKKSLERSHETKAVKYTSRKSKSGVGISEIKQEFLHGEGMEMASTKKKYDPSIDQLQVDDLSQFANYKRATQVEFDISSSHEKFKKCGACRFSEINKDHCKVRGTSDVDRLLSEGLLLSSKNSVHVSERIPSPSVSNVVSSTTSHKVLDSMFIDVVKLMLAQEHPDNAKTASSLSAQEENRNFQATVGETNSRQQTEEHSAAGNNKIRISNQDIMFGNRDLREEVLDGSLSKNVLHSCDVSDLNFPMKTHGCNRNISGDRGFSSQYTTTESDSNNCHLCCGGDVHERKELTTVVDAASSSDDSLRDSYGSINELTTSERRKYDPQEGGSKIRETAKSLQVKLQIIPNEKQNGRRSRKSHKNTETLMVPVITRSPETVQSSSDGSLFGLQHCEGSREASNCDVSEESVSDCVAIKEKCNSTTSEKDVLHFRNSNTRIDSNSVAHSHITDQRVLDELSMESNYVYSASCVHCCSSTCSVGQNLDNRSMATEEEEDHESQGCATEVEPLTNENGTHKSFHEFSVVSVKSSKLHRFFSKSSSNTDSIEDCHEDYHQTSRAGKNSGKIQLPLRKVDAKTLLLGVNSTSGDRESSLDESEKPEKGCSSATLLGTGSTSAKVPPLLRRFITLEKHKGRLAFASSFIGKAKTALSRVRSRSLSPTALGTKIKSMFFRDSRGQALPKKPTVPVGPRTGLIQGAGSKQGKSSRQSVGSKQVTVSKKGEVSKQTTGSKQKAVSSAISKELHPPCDIGTRANQATIRDGPVAKEQHKPLFKSSHCSVQISLKPERNRHHVFRSGKVKTPHSKETKARRSQSYTDITSKRKFSATSCAMTHSECATSDNSSPSDPDLSGNLRRRITHYLGRQYKNLEQAQSTSPLFSMMTSPVLESIAEAESPSEESKADGEATHLMCERLFGRKNFMKDSLSKVATSGCDDGPCPVSAIVAAGGQQTRGRKPDVRMSSSYEDCKSEYGDSSLCNGICMPALMKTHSLVSNLEADQSELRASNGLAIISQEVKIKRYPSFPNLTDINDEDYSITSVKTCGSNAFAVSGNTFEKDPFTLSEDGEIKHTNSSHTDTFSTPNTRLQCGMIYNGGCTIKQNMQTEFSPNLVEQGKMETERGRAVTELVNLPSPPDDSSNELCAFLNIDQENMPTTSKLMTRTENCDNNLQMSRVALSHDDIPEDGGMPVVSEVNHDISLREGRQLLEEAEQIALENVCNYFPFERRQFDSQKSAENAQLSCPKQEDHVDKGISCTLENENNLNKNTFCEHEHGEDAIQELCVHVCREHLLLPQVGDTNMVYSESRVHDGNSCVTSHSINTANEVSANATSEVLTNAISQFSINSTSQQLTINTTNQLCTSTTNQEVYETTKSLTFDTYPSSLEKDNSSNDDTKDLKMKHASLVDPNTRVPLRDNYEDNTTSCGSRTGCAEDENLRDPQNELMCDGSLFVIAENTYTLADDEGEAAAVRSKNTPPEPFRYTNGGGNVLLNAVEYRQVSTIQGKTVLDTCNSCLSDVETEGETPYSDNVSLDGKKTKTVTTTSSKKTVVRENRTKMNNKTYVLRFADSKTKPAKSETALVKTANAKKKKQCGYQSAVDIPKRCPIGKKDILRNTKSTTNGLSKCGGKFIDVDISSFKTIGGSKQFIVTSASSIFGAPYKKPIFGLKSVKNLKSKSINVLKVKTEATDEKKSDTLTISKKTQIQNFKITKAKTDLNLSFPSKSSLNAAPSCDDVDHNTLDLTVRPDTSSDILNHSDCGNSHMPEHVLDTDTSFQACAHQEASASFPVKLFPGGTTLKKISRRVSWSGRTTYTKDDFTSRTQYHLRRCDELLQRSTGILKRSQEMSCRAQRQMEDSAEELQLMNCAASRQPE